MGTLIGSIPTTEEDDIKLAKEILNGKEYIYNSTELLNKTLQKIFKKDDLYLFNRGREALLFALQLLGLTEGDEIAVQAMTCVAVIEPILQIKAHPVYVDINPQNFTMSIEDLERKITSKTKAVIVQHTFGNIADIEKISNIAKKHNLFLIEDCAHLFYPDFSKSNVNKYSDISFFSFAQDKALSAVQGGLTVINNEELKSKAIDLYLNIEDQSWLQASYNARYVVLWSFIRKYYFTPLIPFQKRITIGKVAILLFRYLRLIKQQATTKIETTIKMNRISDVQSRLLLNQLNKCERFNNERKVNEELYISNLLPQFKNKLNSDIKLRYVLTVESPIEVMNQLRKEKVIAGRWYNSVVFPIKNSTANIEYRTGECPVAEEMSKHIINLPLTGKLADGIVKKISDIVNRYGKPFNFIK